MLRILAFGILATAFSATAVSADEKTVWFRDLDAAKQEAKTSHKDILIVFTGKGWCHPCRLLEKEVLTQPAFENRVRGDYVLVELDSTFGDTKEEEARASRFHALQEKYLIRGFPTVVLADGEGVPYALRAGYSTGIGVAPCLLMIKLAQFARTQRDRNFQQAAATTGRERGESLDRGIGAVAVMLGSLEERGDDPVLVFYRPQIEEIRKADETVWSRYETRRKERDRWVAREAIFSRLKEFDEKHYRDAIAYLDEQLKKVDDTKLHWRLECARQTYLEWDRQHEKALTNALRLMDGPGLTEKDRDYLRGRQAYNLHNLGRIDELISLYDRRLAASRGDSRKSLTLLRDKAQWINYHDRPEQAQAAWRAYRTASKPGSEDWLYATQGLAKQLRKAGQFRAALELLEESLRVNEAIGFLFEAAESHIGLGEMEKALADLSKAEAAARPLEGSRNNLDAEFFASIQKRLKTLRARCEAK